MFNELITKYHELDNRVKYLSGVLENNNTMFDAISLTTALEKRADFVSRNTKFGIDYFECKPYLTTDVLANFMEAQSAYDALTWLTHYMALKYFEETIKDMDDFTEEDIYTIPAFTVTPPIPVCLWDALVECRRRYQSGRNSELQECFDVIKKYYEELNEYVLRETADLRQEEVFDKAVRNVMELITG